MNVNLLPDYRRGHSDFVRVDDGFEQIDVRDNQRQDLDQFHFLYQIIEDNHDTLRLDGG